MKQTNKHLELLQWCINNESDSFDISYTFNHGVSWIYALGGNVSIHSINADEVDSTISRLDNAKKAFTPEAIKEKRKAELLKELAELEGQ